MLTDASRFEQFPALARMTYLNTAAESIPPLCVEQAVNEYLRDKALGMRGRDGHFAQVEKCRAVCARLLNLAPAEVSFCSCSSEAYNLLASALQLRDSDEVVVTDIDFPAGITPWMRAANPPSLQVWKADRGELVLEELSRLLGPKTRLVQVSLVSFYSGHRIAWEPFHQMVRSLAPDAVIAVDITQAFGRIPIPCHNADIIISSTHKWTLGIHGGCVIGVPAASAQRLTTTAGGWYHLLNAFDSDRFERAVSKKGAASFSVGMPNFVSLYALGASLSYLESMGIENICAHADPLTKQVDKGLRSLGLTPLCEWRPNNPTGIVAFKHEQSATFHAALDAEQIHVMHQAGRIRIAIHGYNTQDDVSRLLSVLESLQKDGVFC
jgi:selenocysteine lyase/cysteine desulfurase